MLKPATFCPSFNFRMVLERLFFIFEQVIVIKRIAVTLN